MKQNLRLRTFATFLLSLSLTFPLAVALQSTALAAPSSSSSSSSESSDLTPRIVRKNYDGEVPKGMHLVRTRTGELWLLPDGVETPPESAVEIDYYKQKRGEPAPHQIGSLNGQKLYDRGFSAEQTFQDVDFYSLVPESFAEVLWREKHQNLHAIESRDLQSLGDFGPAKDRSFLVPYIPLPEEALSFAYLADVARPDTKHLVKFVADGKTYYRFFIHPNHVDAYEELIAKYGIVYHYLGLSTSSPRSLILVDPAKPGKAYWVKPSLHKKLDGSVRINHDGKVRRAVIMSEAIAQVPKSVLEKLHLKFMIEPASLLPKGKLSGTIFREIAPEFLNPAKGKKWIPAFTLTAPSEKDADETVLAAMIRKSRMQSSDFLREKIVRPLLHSYIGMGMIEGLPGELHTQNFYYEVNSRGLPTGELLFKDNDGFRFDVELAIRQGRGLDFLSRFDEPFVWAKYSNALGYGMEGIPFIGSWYYKLIRNVSGFETLSAYCLRVLQELEPRQGWDKDKIQSLFDQVAAEEAAKITNILVPTEDYGYGDDKGLNYVLNRWRTQQAQMALPADFDASQLDAKRQAYLASEFERLRGAKRVSALRRSVSRTTYYVVHRLPDDAYVIEARTTRITDANPDPVVGFALLEPAGTRRGDAFRKRVPCDELLGLTP